LRTRLHDHTNNFRVYSRKSAETLIEKVSCNGFEWFIVSILAARSDNIRIKEVPITLTNRKRGKSKLNFKNIIAFAKTILRHISKERAEIFTFVIF
jgi:hypothetical protein